MSKKYVNAASISKYLGFNTFHLTRYYGTDKKIGLLKVSDKLIVIRYPITF